jgi:hypothetical protein
VSLAEKLKRHTFEPLRALFLTCIVCKVSPANLTEAEDAITGLPSAPQTPSNRELEAIGDDALSQLLKALKRTRINSLRNASVHKDAHRPTRDQAETALEQTRAILLPLTQRLELYDDVNWYLHESHVRIRRAWPP